jgi:hypothetical protein
VRSCYADEALDLGKLRIAVGRGKAFKQRPEIIRVRGDVTSDLDVNLPQFAGDDFLFLS